MNLPGVLDDTLEDLTDLEGIVDDLLELDEVWLPDLKNRKIMQIISRIFLKIVLFFQNFTHRGTDGVIASQVRTASLRAFTW